MKALWWCTKAWVVGRRRRRAAFIMVMDRGSFVWIFEVFVIDLFLLDNCNR
jgi:hypothetical protein